VTSRSCGTLRSTLSQQCCRAGRPWCCGEQSVAACCSGLQHNCSCSFGCAATVLSKQRMLMH
jgi:hypothetical protein